MIKFTPHALFQMKIRKISKKRVIDTIETPDFVSKGEGNRIVSNRIWGRKLYRVICIKGDEGIVVITAYKTFPERHENESKVR